MDPSATGFVEVYRAKTIAQAHLLRNLLEEAGIEAKVENDLLQGAVGELPLGWATMPRILVAESQMEQARPLLEQFDATAPPREDQDTEEGTRCLSCGARMPENTDQCPACGWSYKAGAAEA